MDADRDPHRDFMVELISELFSGKWKEAPSERVMLFTESAPADTTTPLPPVSAVWMAGSTGVDVVRGSPQKRGSAVYSKQLFKEMSRKRQI
ncbi:hypothetical protein PInf_001135 [Phytophthora infestans]|nr:hypothetical protein PInf_001135 [Phytophthora infestans]